MNPKDKVYMYAEGVALVLAILAVVAGVAAFIGMFA